MKANVDKCHLLVTRDTDVTAKIGEFDDENSMAFFRKPCFFLLQNGKPKVTCTQKIHKFCGSSKT